MIKLISFFIIQTLNNRSMKFEFDEILIKLTDLLFKDLSLYIIIIKTILITIIFFNNVKFIINVSIY